MSAMSRVLGWLRNFFIRPPRVSSASGIDFSKLREVLRYKIQNEQLFSEALSHRSYLQISPSGTALSNERLEFLGDAVLNLVVAEHHFRSDTSAHEGDLTKIRSRLV